ncbi:MAG: hypothetical protein COA79_17170 [Planctomycetota bacterium]|nr:MAG: hypothetical protein COA79_17170 [Planctomycetota bacterium]
MANEFLKKTIVITGASRGIGAAMALQFAQKGANLILGYQNESDALENLRVEMNPFKENIHFIKGNISEPEVSNNLCTTALTKFNSLDIVIANAGKHYFGPFAKIDEEELRALLDTNQLGVYFLLKEAGKIMKKNKAGIVLTVSSTFASSVTRMNVLYAASKSFVETMTKGFALEYSKYGIRANVIAPGITETEMNRVALATSRESMKESNLQHKIAQPNEIAKVALFLCSNDASHVNGQIVKVDGGSLGGF